AGPPIKVRRSPAIEDLVKRDEQLRRSQDRVRREHASSLAIGTFTITGRGHLVAGGRGSNQGEAPGWSLHLHPRGRRSSRRIVCSPVRTKEPGRSRRAAL